MEIFISSDLTQIFNFPTTISDCDSHSPALLDVFLSADASICSAMTFPPLGNSDHVIVSVSIDHSWQRVSNFPYCMKIPQYCLPPFSNVFLLEKSEPSPFLQTFQKLNLPT